MRNERMSARFSWLFFNFQLSNLLTDFSLVAAPSTPCSIFFFLFSRRCQLGNFNRNAGMAAINLTSSMTLTVTERRKCFVAMVVVVPLRPK
jgi:hypothetical protein